MQEDALEAMPTLPEAARYPVPPAVRPAPELIAAVAKLLSGTKNPVIFAGRCSRSIEGWNARVALAEKINAPILTNVKLAAALLHIRRQTMEVFSDRQQRQPTVFKYSTPEVKQGKTIKWLCKSDIMYAGVQVIATGGENNMHSHSGQDGFFLVLKGRARFYGENDVLIAEIGPLEGVHIPRDLHYWFESGSEEVLELLQVESLDKAVKNIRTDYKPRLPGRAANSPDNINKQATT